ncbi:MAG: beta-galactosidase [Prevotella sp.]|nr:beta-galactosidase [Prevotella sp.]
MTMILLLTAGLMIYAAGFGKEVGWDSYGLTIDGRRVCPVMGEIHYSRIPANEWAYAIRKMKEGGVNIAATYVFWNHIEEQEGIYRWDGQRDLRSFLETCREEDMPVVLRIGPFCHGEVRNGGIPDWVFSKGCKIRSTQPAFLKLVDRLYRQIFTQVSGLQWKDHGPVIACQFDNEYRGSGDYLMALKEMARKAGFDLPFYTRTGWPELSKPVAFGEMIPLYGDYADGFWDKETKECTGNYYKAFNFKAFRSSTAIGTDLLGQQKEERSEADRQYPYFTCELGGGMATAYHRRPYIYADDCYSLAIVKLGSGSNLLGYYMYHGGSNPESTTGITLNETQRTPGTANNDLPQVTYDFQAPLGEFGQTYPQYFRLRPIHLFMHDYGDRLATMEAHFPAPQDIRKGEDGQLRWAYRTADDSGFIFFNNYERLQPLAAKKDIQLAACDVELPKITIPVGSMGIFPVNIDGIRFATAQLVAHRDNKIYLMQIEGIPTIIYTKDGKKLRNVKPKGIAKPIYENLYLLTQEEAEHLFLPIRQEEKGQWTAEYVKLKEAGRLRNITKGPARVAEAPSEEDWREAASYQISLPADSSAYEQSRLLLSIDYQGDCARLYAQGRLVADNFQYGRPFLYGLWRLPEACKELELRILPLQPEAPIYLPREADKTPGERVKGISIIPNQ